MRETLLPKPHLANTQEARSRAARRRFVEVGFRTGDLRARVIAGALQDDPVRLHGALAAALDLYPPSVALDDVFTPAVAALDLIGADPAGRARTAIAAHLRCWRQAPSTGGTNDGATAPRA